MSHLIRVRKCSKVLLLKVSDKKLTLNEEDNIYFNSQLPHGMKVLNRKSHNEENCTDSRLQMPTSLFTVTRSSLPPTSVMPDNMEQAAEYADGRLGNKEWNMQLLQ